MDTDEKVILALAKQNLKLTKQCKEILEDIRDLNRALDKGTNKSKKNKGED